MCNAIRKGVYDLDLIPQGGRSKGTLLEILDLLKTIYLKIRDLLLELIHIEGLEREDIMECGDGYDVNEREMSENREKGREREERLQKFH